MASLESLAGTFNVVLHVVNGTLVDHFTLSNRIFQILLALCYCFRVVLLPSRLIICNVRFHGLNCTLVVSSARLDGVLQ